MSRATIPAALLLLTGAAACAARPPLTADVERGVPSARLAVRIGERAGATGDHPVESITILRSTNEGRMKGGGGVVWMAAHVKDQPYLRPPLTIPAGAPMPGYASSDLPHLVPGEYELRVTAGGVSAQSRFRVTVRDSIE